MDFLYIKSKAHVWSNIIFFLVGIATGSLELLIAFSILGFTSWMGHLKGDKWWIADWAGMYIAFTGIIFYNFGLPFLIYPAIPFLFWLAFKKPDLNNFTTIGSIWIISVISAYLAGTAFLPALVAFALAYYLRQRQPNIDQPGYNLFHSLWHVFAGIGMYLLVYKLLF